MCFVLNNNIFLICIKNLGTFHDLTSLNYVSKRDCEFILKHILSHVIKNEEYHHDPNFINDCLEYTKNYVIEDFSKLFNLLSIKKFGLMLDLKQIESSIHTTLESYEPINIGGKEKNIK